MLIASLASRSWSSSSAVSDLARNSRVRSGLQELVRMADGVVLKGLFGCVDRTID
jgi:hypothetical protein